MSDKYLECKKIYLRRCCDTIFYGFLGQCLFLVIFSILINFTFLHPIQWITQTFSNIFSWYSGFFLLPTMFAMVVMNVYSLNKQYVTERVYYPTRFQFLRNQAPQQLAIFLFHILYGFLTTCFYAKFLHSDYSSILGDIITGETSSSSTNDRRYNINPKFVLILVNGLLASIYYFMRYEMKKEWQLIFPIIQQSRFLELRSNIPKILYKLCLESILPTLLCLFTFWAFGGVPISILAYSFNFHFNGTYEIFEINLYISMLLIFWLIICNLNIANFLFVTFLTEYEHFPIQQIDFIMNDQQQQQQQSQQSSPLILVEALCTRYPIIQKLAAKDFYYLSNQDYGRRQQIFTLSVPGGHPYKWIALIGQCLSAINAFRTDLENAMKPIAVNKNESSTLGGGGGNVIGGGSIAGGGLGIGNGYYSTAALSSPLSMGQTPATEMAHKILLRQYNEARGIRHMTTTNSQDHRDINLTEQNHHNSICTQFNKTVNILLDKIQRLKNVFFKMPAINYFFVEKNNGRIEFLLTAYGQTISWITQSVATLAAHSLTEDKYGVVQTDLSNIMDSLIKLKLVLDKISLINFHDSKYHYRCVSCKSAVKRSLYHIATDFQNYLKDLIFDQNQLNIMNNFAEYREA